MNTETEVKIPRTIKDPKLLNGVWRLKYKLTNRMGVAGFSGRLLSSYTDTLTGVPRHLYNEHGQMQPGYFIEKQTTIFNPAENILHRNIVDWLIGHPNVSIQQNQVGLSDKFMAKKDDNPRIELINLDHEEIEDLVDEDFIDKLVGRISQDLGKNCLGIQTLRFVLAKLNMPYIEMKYVTNQTIEKQKLRKRLKDFVRAGVGTKNAKVVVEILDNLASAKYEYEIKEMMRHEILYIANAMYKYEGNPLGTSMDSVVKYFTNNPDFYTEISEILYDKLKLEAQEQ